MALGGDEGARAFFRPALLIELEIKRDLSAYFYYLAAAKMSISFARKPRQLPDGCRISVPITGYPRRARIGL